MQSLTLRHMLLLLLAPLQFVTSRWHEISGAGRSVGDMAADAPTFATPAGYAFFIWVLIFTLQTLYAGWQARPSQRNGLLYARLGWPLVISLAASNLWMLTAIYAGNGLALLVLILIMAAAVFTALLRAVASLSADVSSTPATTWLVIPMLGICAGWLTLATFLNLAGTLQLTLGLPTGTPMGGISTLLAAFITAGAMLMLLKSSGAATQAYGGAVIWGLLAVTLANTVSGLSPVGLANPAVAFTAWFSAAIMVLAMAVVLRRS